MKTTGLKVKNQQGINTAIDYFQTLKGLENARDFYFNRRDKLEKILESLDYEGALIRSAPISAEIESCGAGRFKGEIITGMEIRCNLARDLANRHEDYSFGIIVRLVLVNGNERFRFNLAKTENLSFCETIFSKKRLNISEDINNMMTLSDERPFLEILNFLVKAFTEMQNILPKGIKLKKHFHVNDR